MLLATSYASLWVELAGMTFFLYFARAFTGCKPWLFWTPSHGQHIYMTGLWAHSGLILPNFPILRSWFSTSGKFWFSGIVASNTMRGWRSVVAVLDKQTSIIMPHPENPPPRNRPTPLGENRKSQHKNSSCVCVRAKQSDITIEKCSRCAINRRRSLCPTPKHLPPRTPTPNPSQNTPEANVRKMLCWARKNSPRHAFPCSGSSVCARLHHVRGNNKVMASNYPQIHPNTHSSKHKGPRSEHARDRVVAVVVAVAVVDAIPCAANISEQARWETSNPRYVRTLGNVCWVFATPVLPSMPPKDAWNLHTDVIGIAHIAGRIVDLTVPHEVSTVLWSWLCSTKYGRWEWPGCLGTGRNHQPNHRNLTYLENLQVFLSHLCWSPCF